MAKIDVDKTYESSMAAPIIVIALSNIAVVIIYITIGHIGPTYHVPTTRKSKKAIWFAGGTGHHKSENSTNPTFDKERTT